ncbi:MAG: tetratricopeptide repeat protein, partial [Bacteroidales bacterium]|nr:tetratricopeptide repeat protein [Bacteroidales bacterium]
SIEAYKKALKLFNKENCDDIYSSIGIEYMMMFQYEPALKYLIKGLKGSPDIYEQYIEITNCFFFLDRSDEALEFFTKEIDNNPYSIAAWMALGNCYLRLQLLEKAMEQYEYALAIDQHYEKAYINIATILNELDRYKDSIDIIEEAFRNKVEKPLLYCLYGEAMARTGNKLEAVNNFKKAIELDDNIAEAYAGMGFVFCDEEEHESAIKFLKRAHQLAPYNMDYVFVLVEQHNKLGKYKTSLKYLKEIEETTPYEINLYIAYMEVYILLDDVDKAIKSIEKGMRLLGRKAPLLYRLAFINFVQEDFELGMYNLEEALNMDCDGVQEFIDFDPNFVLNNENILNLINEYKNKNNK